MRIVGEITDRLDPTNRGLGILFVHLERASYTGLQP
jgi:hypothetical protein